MSETTEGVPAPRANPDCLGHERAERQLRGLYDARRLPHAILLSGPRGIGKATLAFRFARFLLAQSTDTFLGASGEGLAIDPESSVFRRVVGGGHADLLTIERAYDARRRRLRSEIVVEDTREITGFFRLTSAEEGWRIVIVDGADEMNRNAANALLKILEEPPRRALLLLISHSPGRLLPTIRSRCRRFPLTELSLPIVAQLLQRYRPELAQAEANALAELAQGSIGRAIDLADAGGLALYRALLDMLARAPRYDGAALHAFAEKFTRPDSEDAYRVVRDLLATLLARTALCAARGNRPGEDAIPGEEEVIRSICGRSDPLRWTGLCQQIEQNFADADLLNLDRKQTILAAFFAIAEAAI